MNVTITPEEMRLTEQRWMAETGVPGALLMEHAAQGVVQALRRHTGPARVIFLCGPGNNGGDGYAAARLWQAEGGRAQVLELTDQLRGDALMNRRLALIEGVSVAPLTADAPLEGCAAVVDALYGTGLSRELDGTAAQLIRRVNASGLPVVAVDIPSGLDGLTGRVRGCAVEATETVTFHRIKPGLLLGDSARHTGRITRHSILLPADEGPRDGLRILEPEDLPRLIPPRPADAHKGSMGRVVILAGSEGMAGAAAFCAAAAVKTGAGLTSVLCRRAVLPVVQAQAPEATCTLLPEAEGRLTPDAAEVLARALRGADAAVVGCGLGQSEDLLPLMKLLREAACPVVWDADALNLLAAHGELLPLPANAVVTPHPGEAARLLGCSTADVVADPLAALRRLHERCGCGVLLKGARSLMTDGTALAVNRHGTPALAKGGSGDVLSGILGALLARRLPCDPLEVTQLAALIHGLAGLRCAAALGENCLTPTALVDAIRLDDRP